MIWFASAIVNGLVGSNCSIYYSDNGSYQTYRLKNISYDIIYNIEYLIEFNTNRTFGSHFIKTSHTMHPVPETQTDTLKTADQVALAAHKLLRQGQGQAITQRKIYEAIGNRGSMKTIQQALGDFWADLGNHLQQLEYLQGFPPEALTPLLEAFAGIRTQAEAQSRSDYEAKTQAARTAIEQADTDRRAALETLDVAKSEIQTLKHQLEQLVEKRDALQQQLASEIDRRQTLEVQIPTLREETRVRLEQADSQTQRAQIALHKEEERHQATELRLTTLYDQERTARAEERTQALKAQERLQEKLETINKTYLAAKQVGA